MPANTKTNIRCNECGRNFKRVIRESTYEIRCPNCGGYDTEPEFELVGRLLTAQNMRGIKASEINSKFRLEALKLRNERQAGLETGRKE